MAKKDKKGKVKDEESGGGNAKWSDANDALVTFEWNILLDLSGEAATKTFSSLVTELLLQVLG